MTNQKYKLVPVEPTPEMMGAARNAPMPMILIDSIAGRQDLTNASVYRTMMAAAPAVQGELVGWQFYKHGKWWNGDILTKNQRKNIEEEGVRVRNVYAEPQFAGQQPEPDVAGLVEALQKEATSLCDAVENINDLPPVMYALKAGTAVNKVRDAVAALAAHRKQGGG